MLRSTPKELRLCSGDGQFMVTPSFVYEEAVTMFEK